MPKPPARRAPEPSGFTITPRSLRLALTVIACFAAAWKPIEVGMKLSTAIDNLTTAVSDLRGVMKDQGADIIVLKGEVASLKAVKESRDQQIASLQQQIQALQQGRR